VRSRAVAVLDGVNREGPVEERRQPLDLGIELRPGVACPRAPANDPDDGSLSGADLPGPRDPAVDDDKRRHPAGGPVDVVVVRDRQDRFDSSRQLVDERIEPGQETDATEGLLTLEDRQIVRPHECPETVHVDDGERDGDPFERAADEPRALGAPPAFDHVPAAARKRCEEPPDHPCQGVDRLIGIGPFGEGDRPLEPAGRMDERDVSARVRSEDELAALGRCAEVRAPAGSETRREARVGHPRRHGVRQVAPRQRLVR
jgi:hypothetical protein